MLNNTASNYIKNPAPVRNRARKYKAPRRVAAGIKDKLAEHDAVILKADKGSSTVIMSKTEYTNKVLEFISKNNITDIGHDPTQRFTKEINSLISKSKLLFTDAEIKALKVTNPGAPILRGLPKLHKNDVPIRPLVNFTPAPTYIVAKRLDSIIRNLVTLENSHSLKNSIDLVNKISTTKIQNNHRLASFDIVNLYTNIPVEETLIILENNLIENSALPKETIDQLIILTRAVLKQNYFKFDDKFYIQNEGLAMGSPLSCILAELFLNHIENKYVWSDKNKYLKKIIFYFRYVDDIIVLFNSNSRQLTLLNKYLNSVHSNLKFTLEEEANNRLNYLDLTIMKCNNSLKFKIYRKPTTTSQTINNNSHHPQNQKMAAYNSFVHRLLSVPMDQTDYEEEVSIIKFIAVANGYKSSIVDNLIIKHKNRASKTENVERKYVSSEYGLVLSNKLKQEMNKHNITVSFKTSNKLDRLLQGKNVNNSQDKFNQTGVYKMTCSDCPSVYIGQTSRSFKIRFKEHLPRPSDALLTTPRSAFASHLISNDHSYENIHQNMEIMQLCRRGAYMSSVEEFLIYQAVKSEPQNVLNDKLTFKNNIIYNTALQIIKSNEQLNGMDNG